MEATAIFFSRAVSLRYSWSRRLSSPVSSGSSCSSTRRKHGGGRLGVRIPALPSSTRGQGSPGQRQGGCDRETSEALPQLSQGWPLTSRGRALLS